MNKLIAAMVAVSLLATPALAADFTGPRVEAQIGIDTGYNGNGFNNDGFYYGVEAGYDFAVAKGVTLGPVVGISDSTNTQYYNILTSGRNIEAGVQLGVQTSEKTMLAARVSYQNARVNVDYGCGCTTYIDYNGALFGVSGQYVITPALYSSLAYNYITYGDGVSRNIVKAGLGYRF